MTNPFAFIVGCPRSGTTMLQRMVAAHPAIAVIPECAEIPSQFENREFVTAEGMVTPRLVENIVKKKLGRYSELPATRREIDAVVAPGIRYPDLISWLFDKYGESQGKRLVANKTVDYALVVPTLHSLWPRARFVHLIRDGRDVCLSATNWRRAPKLAERFPTWAEDPAGTAALWWEWHVRKAREDGRPLGSRLYYEIRYEALVAQPEAELRTLCAFLDVPYDDGMIRFHEGRGKEEDGLDAKHAWAPPTAGLRDWRSQMSHQDVERFEAVAGGLLEELGYPITLRQASSEALEHAARLRRQFTGRPVPQVWSARAGADSVGSHVDSIHEVNRAHTAPRQ